MSKHPRHPETLIRIKPLKRCDVASRRMAATVSAAPLELVMGRAYKASSSKAPQEETLLTWEPRSS